MRTTTVAITGSTRGLGFGLARAFLDLGCRVAVSGRNASAVDAAVARLGGPSARLVGQVCEVTSYDQLAALWDAAAGPTDAVDVWINNAGAGIAPVPLAGQSPEAVRRVVEANLVGAMLGTRLALEKMAARGAGQIFNVEGFGSDGRSKRTGMASYGATKAAVRYFTESVAREAAGGPVRVGALVPGVVVTDMLREQLDGLAPEARRRAERLYGALADRVETVAPWLARQVLANRRTGARIAWLTAPKIAARLLGSLFRRRDVLARLTPPSLQGENA